MIRTNRTLAAALAAALMAGAAPAAAQVNPREPDPSVWLRQVYDHYRRAETAANKLHGPTDMDIVGARASRSLAALFRRENDCTRRSHEICALDWDFIIDGQDWELAKVKVGAPVVAGDRATVTVSFTNFGTPSVNVYAFVREDGAWRVDDIETRSGRDAPIRIAKLLKDYDYRQ